MRVYTPKDRGCTPVAWTNQGPEALARIPERPFKSDKRVMHDASRSGSDRHWLFKRECIMNEAPEMSQKQECQDFSINKRRPETRCVRVGAAGTK